MPIMKNDGNSTINHSEDEPTLSAAEEAFAQAVIKWHGNQSRAWRETHPESKACDRTVWTEASTLAARPNVSRRVLELQRLQSVSAADVVAAVVKRARAIVESDSNALVQTRIGCCRNCWGLEHRYQRTAREYLQAWDDYARQLDAVKPDDLAPLPFDDGGDGFDFTRAPNADCPECGGEGVPREVMPDTRNLSPEAALLYAGVKRTKNGLEVLTEDRRAWAELLMKWSGAYVEKRELSGPGGAPISTTGTAISVTATPDEAARLYADMVKGGSS